MSKPATRRARKRNRSISLPGGETVPQPATQGARHDLAPQEDPRMVALAVRERITGLTGADALAPDQGDAMGRCIVNLCSGQDRSDMLNLWRGMTGARANYMMRYIGQTGNPKGAAFGFISEAIETDQSLRIDIRSPEDKAAQAVASWTTWLAKINALPLVYKWPINNALGLSLGAVCLWRNQAPTPQGKASVAAIRALCGTS